MKKTMFSLAAVGCILSSGHALATTIAQDLYGYVGQVTMKLTASTEFNSTAYPGETWGIFQLTDIFKSSDGVLSESQASWNYSGNSTQYFGILYGLYDVGEAGELGTNGIDQNPAGFTVYEVTNGTAYNAVIDDTLRSIDGKNYSTWGTNVAFSGIFEAADSLGQSANQVVLTETFGTSTGHADSYASIVGDDDLYSYLFDSNGVQGILGGLLDPIPTGVYHDFKIDYTITSLTFNAADRSYLGYGNDPITANTNPVPEPATMLLFGTGLVGLAGFRKRKKSE